MNAKMPSVRTTALATISLLDEGPMPDAVCRMFRGRPVLAQTVDRVRRAAGVDGVAVLAWDDQLSALATIEGLRVTSRGIRRPTVAMQARAAALRWTDGWRGGLLGVTEFDRGFDADAVAEAMDAVAAESTLLVSASSALVDPQLLSSILTRLNDDAMSAGYSFAAGVPGSVAMALSRKVIEQLRADSAGPGLLLSYHPDRARHDPLAREPSAPIEPIVARSTARLTLDSARQSHRLSLARADEPGLSTADRIQRWAEATGRLDLMPREVIVELTTRRATSPSFSIVRRGPVARPDADVDSLRRLFDQIAASDDLRVTFAGVGDPLLHPQFSEAIASARAAGIRAIHVETDLLPDSQANLSALAGSVDIVSIHLPAASRAMYRNIMGVDRIDDVLNNIRVLLVERNARGALPILVPTFVKLAANLGEMEAWYDQWLRAIGAAAIVGPSDFGGAIPYAGVADMTPPARSVCRSLQSRLMVLSDGAIVACEQDVLCRRPVGHLKERGIEAAWQSGMRAIRAAHEAEQWTKASPVCTACRMWDRP